MKKNYHHYSHPSEKYCEGDHEYFNHPHNKQQYDLKNHPGPVDEVGEQEQKLQVNALNERIKLLLDQDYMNTLTIEEYKKKFTSQNQEIQALQKQIEDLQHQLRHAHDTKNVPIKVPIINKEQQLLQSVKDHKKQIQDQDKQIESLNQILQEKVDLNQEQAIQNHKNKDEHERLLQIGKQEGEMNLQELQSKIEYLERQILLQKQKSDEKEEDQRIKDMTIPKNGSRPSFYQPLNVTQRPIYDDYQQQPNYQPTYHQPSNFQQPNYQQPNNYQQPTNYQLSPNYPSNFQQPPIFIPQGSRLNLIPVFLYQG